MPIYFIRYEDLRLNPQETLEGVFKFLLEVPSVDNLNIQRRISEVVNKGHKATVTYNQKVESTDLKKAEVKPIVFNRNISSFNDDQQKYVSEQLRDFNHIFGYCSQNAPAHDWLQEQQTKFNFFKYEQIDSEMLNKF